MFKQSLDSFLTFKDNLNPKNKVYVEAIRTRNNLLKTMADHILDSSEEKWIIENRLEQIDAQVKSRKRIVDLAEVLTNRREVEAMIKLVNHSQYNKDKTVNPEACYLSFQPLSNWLEPAVGDGNFIVVILSHKLSKNAYDFIAHLPKRGKKTEAVRLLEFNIIKSLSSIYAVDIDRSNVDKTRERMIRMVKNFYNKIITELANGEPTTIPDNTLSLMTSIIQRNIILGNTIEDSPSAELNTHKMHVVEYKFNDDTFSISMRAFTYSELAQPDFTPEFKIQDEFTSEIIQNITHAPTVNNILQKNDLPKIVNLKSTLKDTVLEEIKDSKALEKEAARIKKREEAVAKKTEEANQKKIKELKEADASGMTLFSIIEEEK